MKESRTRHREAIPSPALPLTWLSLAWTTPDTHSETACQPPAPKDAQHCPIPIHTCTAPGEGSGHEPEELSPGQTGAARGGRKASTAWG